MADSNDYSINFFKPVSPKARADMKVVITMVIIWAVAVFGFQILLQFTEAKPEEPYKKYLEIFTGDPESSEPPEKIDFLNINDQNKKEYSKILLRNLGKNVAVTADHKRELKEALTLLIYDLLPEQERAGFQQKIKELVDKESEYYTLRAKVKKGFRSIDLYAGYHTCLTSEEATQFYKDNEKDKEALQKIAISENDKNCFNIDAIIKEKNKLDGKTLKDIMDYTEANLVAKFKETHQALKDYAETAIGFSEKGYDPLLKDIVPFSLVSLNSLVIHSAAYTKVSKSIDAKLVETEIDPIKKIGRSQVIIFLEDALKLQNKIPETEYASLFKYKFEGTTPTFELQTSLPKIMKKYFIHFHSGLTDTQFLGFPFHYWYTAQFLLILFVILCLIYAIVIEKIHKKYGFVENDSNN